MSDNTQLGHSDHLPAGRHFPLTVIASDFGSPMNVGSLFRLCDAFAVEKLYLCGETPVPPAAKIRKTSRATEKYVDYEYRPDAETVVAVLKQAGTLIIALEITSSSLDIRSEEFASMLKPGQPVCLVLGSENAGVRESLLALSDITVHIPMFGNNSSMNVISAASIACFELIRNL